MCDTPSIGSKEADLFFAFHVGPNFDTCFDFGRKREPVEPLKSPTRVIKDIESTTTSVYKPAPLPSNTL